MNIDDLWNDINEMEDGFETLSSNEKEELQSMINIAIAYDEESEEKCYELIQQHREKFGIKLNIL